MNRSNDVPPPRWTLIAAILGSSMAFIDGTVVNVALPALQRDLNASAFAAQWVIESYALFLASLLLAGGALGDRFGRRRIFMVGVALFTLASIVCGLSTSIGQLIVARCAQGIGAALLVPGSLALISATYPEAQRGRAIGTWSAFSGITAAIGPVIGGYLVDHFSWAWAFLLNAPIGVALLIICTLKVPESRGGNNEAVDFAGATLATLGLAGVVFALVEAPDRGWSSIEVLAAAFTGLACLALFVRVESVGHAPMLPLALFRNRQFAGANLLTLLLYAALSGGLYFFPLNLIQVQGFGAAAAGAAMLPFIAILFALSRWAGQLVDRFGARLPLVVGPAIAAVGFALFTRPGIGGSSYWSTFFPAICTLGLGMTITIAPLTTTVMNAVGAEMSGVASGVNNAVSRAAGLLAIAVFGLVMAVVFDATLSARLAQLHLQPEVLAAVHAQRHKLAGMVLPDGLDAGSAAALKAEIGAAFVGGFRWIMSLCAGLAVLSALSAWLMIDSRAALTVPRTDL